MAFALGPAAVFFAAFGLLFWAMLFLQIYAHFPKMEKRRRLSMSLVESGKLIAVMLALIAIAFLLVMEFIFKIQIV